MQAERPFVMSVAGHDPSGGAGLMADIKTMEQIKVHGLAVCTAMTVQTASECLSLKWQPLEDVLSAIEVLMKSYAVKTVKIGVVKDSAFLQEIIRTIKFHNPDAAVIWDPVLKSTSEFPFFNLETVPHLKSVLHQIDLITPNYHEYTILKENNLLGNPDLCAVLVKGGHRKDHLGTDILIVNGREISIYPSETRRIYYPKHGSGCVLSSAIAGYLAKGENLESACRNGKLYIERFLTGNPTPLGFHSE